MNPYLLYLNDMRTWLYVFLSLFSLGHVSIFLGCASLARHLFSLAHCGSCFFCMPSFLSFSMWVMLLWHAIFPLFFQMERDYQSKIFGVFKTNTCAQELSQ